MNAQELEAELERSFRFSFMKPWIEEGDYWEVETTHGTAIIPGDVVAIPDVNCLFYFNDCVDDETKALAKKLYEYVDGTPIEASTRCGWIARLSAPGYMDCTDWTAHESWEEAAEYLIEQYGDES